MTHPVKGYIMAKMLGCLWGTSEIAMDSVIAKSQLCFSCQKPLNVIAGGFVGRRDTCPHCNSDMHVCYNCKFYDKASYNECREPQAERVVEKGKANFCDYFVLVGPNVDSQETKDEALKKLNDLFKR